MTETELKIANRITSLKSRNKDNQNIVHKLERKLRQHQRNTKQND